MVVQTSVSPPTPPAPPAGKKTSKVKIRKIKPKRIAPKRIISNRFIAPVEVPDVIEEEELDMPFADSGIDGAVGEGEGVFDSEGNGFIPGGSDSIDANAASSRVTRPARCIRKVKPLYSRAAIASRTEGTVLIEAVTDIYGRVRTARVIGGHPLLNASALQAVKQWIYEPYIINGIPKPVKFTVTITFALKNR